MNWLNLLVDGLRWLSGIAMIVLAFWGLRRIAGATGLFLGFLSMGAIIGIYVAVLGSQNGEILYIVGGILTVVLMVGIGYKVVAGRNLKLTIAPSEEVAPGLGKDSLEADNKEKVEFPALKTNVDKANMPLESVADSDLERESSDSSLPKIKPINLPKSDKEYKVIRDTINYITGDKSIPQLEKFMETFLRTPIFLDVDLKTLRNFYDCYGKVYGVINQKDFLAFFPKLGNGGLYTTKEFQQYGKKVISDYLDRFEKMNYQLLEIINKAK